MFLLVLKGIFLFLAGILCYFAFWGLIWRILTYFYETDD